MGNEMENNNIVAWNNSYSVGINLIDDQHRELIKLTNKLYHSCMLSRDNSRAVFMQTIRGAVDYIGYHFSTEEKVMERVGYPDFLVHRVEHADFVKTVLREVDDFQSGKKYVPQNFVYFLRDWVLTHIAVSDKKMGTYLVNLKKQGSLQNMTLKVKKVTKVEEDPEHAGQFTSSKRYIIG